MTDGFASPPPWLEPARAQLEQAIVADRLSHAILIQASAGQGGDWLASWLAARVFCSSGESTRPCGICRECRRVAAREQPDLLWVTRVEESKEIRIDQIRELSAELALTAHGGARKMAIITPADTLNRNAANALLKTLEEPSPSALLVLVTGEPSRLPITVLSRCLRIQPRLPSTADLIAWLQRQGAPGVQWDAVLEAIGCEPLTALQLDATLLTELHRETTRALEAAWAGRLDPVATAESWGRDAYAERIACIEAWLLNRAREWARGAAGSRGTTVASSRALFEALDEAREARQWADTPLHKPLALERLLWRIQSLPRTQGPGRAVDRN